MSVFLSSLRKSKAWPQRLGVAIAFLAVVCAFVIEALHGHECSGDGCILCLIATWASGLLLLCTCIVVVQPIILALAHTRPMQSTKPLASVSRKTLLSSGADALRAATIPVTTPLETTISSL